MVVEISHGQQRIDIHPNHESSRHPTHPAQPIIGGKHKCNYKKERNDETEYVEMQ